jgi:hypothetical protein
MALPGNGHHQFQDAHAHPDTDADAFALHHTLGQQAGQAAPGIHNHGAKLMSAIAGASTGIPANAWTRCTMGSIFEAMPAVVGADNSHFSFNDAADQILIKKKGLYFFSFYASANATGGTFYIRGRHVGGWAGTGYSYYRESGGTPDQALNLAYDLYIPDGASSFALDLYCTVATATQHTTSSDEHLISKIAATYRGDF